MGLALYQKGAYKSAIDLFQEALKLAEKEKAPENPTVHFHLGLAYEKLADKARASEELNRALQLQPTPSEENEIRKLLAYSSPQ